jgi:hypothetical protein
MSKSKYTLYVIVSEVKGVSSSSFTGEKVSFVVSTSADDMTPSVKPQPDLNFSKETISVKINEPDNEVLHVALCWGGKRNLEKLATLAIPVRGVSTGTQCSHTFQMKKTNLWEYDAPSVTLRLHLARAEKPFKGTESSFKQSVLDQLDRPAPASVRPSSLPLAMEYSDFVPPIPVNPNVAQEVRQVAREAVRILPSEYWRYLADPFFIRACVECHARKGGRSLQSNPPAVIAFLRDQPNSYLSPADWPAGMEYPPNSMKVPSAYAYLRGQSMGTFPAPGSSPVAVPPLPERTRYAPGGELSTQGPESEAPMGGLTGLGMGRPWSPWQGETGAPSAQPVRSAFQTRLADEERPSLLDRPSFDPVPSSMWSASPGIAPPPPPMFGQPAGIVARDVSNDRSGSASDRFGAPSSSSSEDDLKPSFGAQQNSFGSLPPPFQTSFGAPPQDSFAPPPLPPPPQPSFGAPPQDSFSLPPPRPSFPEQHSLAPPPPAFQPVEMPPMPEPPRPTLPPPALSTLAPSPSLPTLGNSLGLPPPLPLGGSPLPPLSTVGSLGTIPGMGSPQSPLGAPPPPLGGLSSGLLLGPGPGVSPMLGPPLESALSTGTLPLARPASAFQIPPLGGPTSPLGTGLGLPPPLGGGLRPVLTATQLPPTLLG